MSMKYRVLPLLYSAGPHSVNTLRFGIDFKETIRREALEKAIADGMKRYPYFSVRMERDGEHIVFAHNPLPMVLLEDGGRVCLGSQASNFHLVAFACEDRTLYIDISRFIADETGAMPLVKTVVYAYLLNAYGDQCSVPDIRLPGEPIDPQEYAYPFPPKPLADPHPLPQRALPDTVFVIDRQAYDHDGTYAYLLKVNRCDLTKAADANDATPVSLLSAMMFQAICRLHPQEEKAIVCHVNHSYRETLACPLSHDCLTTALPVVFKPSMAHWSLLRLNTAMRGQLLYAADASMDIQTINAMVLLDAYMDRMPLAVKKQTMRDVVRKAAAKATFQIICPEQTDLGEMAQYIDHIYLLSDERHHDTDLSMQLLMIGDSVSLSLMQPGREDRYVQALMQELQESGIRTTLHAQKRCPLSGSIALP